MKKLIIFLVVLFIAKSAKSQNVNACNNAQNVCGNPNFLFVASTGNGLTSGLNISNPTTNVQIGNGNNPTAPANTGCFQGLGVGPQWLLITVSSSGNLGFSFGAAGSANPQVGFYDWGMWPYTPTTCANIFNNTLPPVSCNWNGSASGGTGMGPVPTGGSFSNFQPSIPVIAGQQYLILISNFSGVNTPVSFTNTGTAGLSCGFSSEVCAGNSVTVSPVGFVPLSNQTFTLFPGGLTNSTGSFVATPLSTTIYTIQGSGLNTQSVQTTQTSTTNVTVNSQPLSSLTSTQTTCTNTISAFNLGLSFFPSSPVPTYTVNWTPMPAGIISSSQTTLSGGIPPGTYTAVITAQGGCSTTTAVTINPAPAASVFSLVPTGSLYSVTCTQPTVVLDGSEVTYSYTWANNVAAPMSGQTTSYTALTLGNWTVTGVQPVSGCVSSRTFTIALNNTAPVSIVTPVNQNINCGPGVVATATGVAISPSLNVTHCWYAPGLPAPSCSGGQTSIYNPPIGTSTFIVTNDINGCFTTKTVQVLSNGGSYPTFTSISSLMTANVFTLGCGTRSLITDITINGASAAGGVAVNYTLLPATFTGTNYTTGSNATYSVNTPGAYVVIIKDVNNLCETRIPLSIIQNTFAPNISAEAVTSRTLSCFVPSISLQGGSTNPFVAYSWKSQNSQPPTIQNRTIAVITTSAGSSVNSATVIDTYTLTVTDQVNTCTSNSVVTIYQNTRPPKGVIALSQPALTCIIFSVNLTNNSTTGVLPNTFFGNQGIGAVLWEGPPPQTDLVNNSSYSAFTAGVYTLTVRDLNNGCTSKTTTAVGDNKVYPVITATNLAVLDCGADLTGTKLAATVSTNSIDIVWNTPETAQVSGEKTLTLTTNDIGIYRLSVTTKSNGCSASFIIKVIDGVLIGDFTPDATTGYAPLTVNFNNNSASSSTTSPTASITSVWSFGNGTTRTTTTNLSTSAIYEQPGTYSVTMFASKGSCLDTVVKVIRVDIPSKLEVPNVFTPNGDNSNDVFFVKTANLSEITALIYDRWGNKIYELTTDKGNIAWDGKSQTGKEAPDGTYFYIITAKGKDGQNYDTKGTISLFR